MKKIGIFIGVESFRHSSKELNREGLIRLTSILISYMSELDNIKPVVVCSEISKSVLFEVFTNVKLEGQIEFLTTKNTPPLFTKILKNINKKDKKKSLINRLMNKTLVKIKEFRYKIIIKSLSSRGFLFGLVFAFMLFLTGFIAIGINFPLYVGCLVLSFISVFLIYRLSKKINKKFANIIKKFTMRLSSSKIAFNLYNKVRDLHVKDLIDVVNKSDLDFVFIPTAFYPEVVNIKKPKVVTVPDIVVCDYPQYFAQMNGSNWKYTIDRIKYLISDNQYFISYSNYVAQRHIYPLASTLLDARVIPHGNLSVSDDLVREFDADSKAYALSLLHGHVKMSNSTYLRGMDFTELKYIVYTSQNRPYKNITTLLKAYDVLLRQKFCNIKLIITGSFEHTPSVAEYIAKHNLQYDVLSLPNLSNKELAALDHLAHLAVNPTLFEGGFPFTFNEAYSVGTPSLMSKIPVVLEVVEEQSLQDTMLFDPYDVDDMVEKIYWGIHHRDELLEMQKPLYDKLAARSWEVVAKEYIDYFQEIMDAHNS